MDVRCHRGREVLRGKLVADLSLSGAEMELRFAVPANPGRGPSGAGERPERGRLRTVSARTARPGAGMMSAGRFSAA